MKVLILFFFILKSSCSQTDELFGEYFFIHDNTGITQHYKLTLNSNGTFEFEQRWKQKNEMLISDKTESYGIEMGKGKWTKENQLILLSSNPNTDLNQNYRLDFSDTKLRVLNNKTIRFEESNLFWAKNLILNKMD